MRKTTIGVLAAGALVASGCGATRFTNTARPPVPVDVTVYIDNAGVSVSPSSIGAGPLKFIVTNQSTHPERLTVLPSGATSGQPLADAGPIDPQATTELALNLNTGNYSIEASPPASTDATLALPSTLHPAVLQIGEPRPDSNSVLLEP